MAKANAMEAKIESPIEVEAKAKAKAKAKVEVKAKAKAKVEAEPNRRLGIALLAVAVATAALAALAVCAPKLLATPASPVTEKTTDPTRDVYMPPASDVAYDADAHIQYAVDVLDVTVDVDDGLALAQKVADSVGGRLVGSIPAIGFHQIRLDEPKSYSELESIARSVEDDFEGVSAASPETLMASAQASPTEGLEA